MLLRLLLGALLSAVVLMLWGFVYWVVLAAPGGALRAAPEDAYLGETLRRALPESGTYYFPAPLHAPGADPEAAMEAFRRRNLAGPTGMVMIRREGSDPMSPRILLLGFGHFFGSSLLAGLLMVLVMPALDTYLHRLVFVIGLGVFAAVAIRLSDPIWWRLPWGHPVYTALYNVIGWALAGLVLAAVVHPPRGYRLTDQRKPLWKRALDVR